MDRCRGDAAPVSVIMFDLDRFKAINDRHGHATGDAVTIKARMGAIHFLMKTLPRVGSEMALYVLAYNLTRVMNIMGIRPLMTAMRA